jgi:epoxyqueuosine reductase
MSASTEPADLARRVRATGLAAGLDRVGVASALPFPEVRAELEARRADGRAGRLRFTFRDPATATDVRASFPWAERLVVGGRSYLPEAGDPGPGRPGSGRVARFAVEDAYRPLRAALQAVEAVLAGHGHRTAVLADDNRLVDRAAAVRAGVGWWGKNAMVLAPGVGPWMLLGSVVTDAPLPPDPPMERDCGTCTACLPACPTGALVAPGVLDARRCLAAWAQTKGVIPVEFRPAMGDRIYGCDDCLEACPPGSRLKKEAVRGRGREDLAWLLEAPEAEVMSRFGHFYLPGRTTRILRRNALVALANSGGEEHLPLVARYLAHSDPLLRLHAAWAVARLGGAGRLAVALEAETDPDVRAEIARVLATPPAGQASDSGK